MKVQSEVKIERQRMTKSAFIGGQKLLFVAINGPGPPGRTTYDAQGRSNLIFMSSVDFNQTQLPFLGSFPSGEKILTHVSDHDHESPCTSFGH